MKPKLQRNPKLDSSFSAAPELEEVRQRNREASARHREKTKRYKEKLEAFVDEIERRQPSEETRTMIHNFRHEKDLLFQKVEPTIDPELRKMRNKLSAQRSRMKRNQLRILLVDLIGNIFLSPGVSPGTLKVIEGADREILDICQKAAADESSCSLYSNASGESNHSDSEVDSSMSSSSSCWDTLDLGLTEQLASSPGGFSDSEDSSSSNLFFEPASPVEPAEVATTIGTPTLSSSPSLFPSLKMDIPTMVETNVDSEYLNNDGLLIMSNGSGEEAVVANLLNNNDSSNEINNNTSNSGSSNNNSMMLPDVTLSSEAREFMEEFFGAWLPPHQSMENVTNNSTSAVRRNPSQPLEMLLVMTFFMRMVTFFSQIQPLFLHLQFIHPHFLPAPFEESNNKNIVITPPLLPHHSCYHHHLNHTGTNNFIPSVS